ncbi:MAG: hypothetical protein COC04_00870 [Gammaproteobacteria bacterium]|nr:MAG: hypothetical protein COC04_00870 [Gammaproteobacteria bacterium]
MGWSELLGTAFAAGKPARGSQVFQIFENVKALALGSDPLSPKIQDLALVQATSGDEHFVFKDDNLYELAFGNNVIGNGLYSTVSLLRVGRGGVYKAKIDASGNTVDDVGYRIYKNGVAFGVLHTRSLTESVTWTEDLQFSAGDIVELRGIYSGTEFSTNLGHVSFSSGVFVPGIVKIS